MTTEKIKVEVGQYRLMRKEGAMRAFFSLLIHPHGVKYLDCRYFSTDDGRKWFTFPQKEIPPKDGDTKKQYIPLVSIMDKEYLEALKEAVLIELKIEDEKAVLNGSQTQNSTGAPLQVKTPAPW